MTFNNMLRALQQAEGTKSTFITADEVGAPTIYGAKIYGAEIYAGGVDNKGGQVIGLTDGGIEIYDGHSHKVLTLREDNGGAIIHTTLNALTISTPYGHIDGFTTFSFHGNTVSFDDVENITGIYATFA